MNDVSPQVWVALIAAFGASLLTTIGSRWVAGFQAKKQGEHDQAKIAHEKELDGLQDERGLRDAKRQRLGDAYVPVVHSATALQSVASQLRFIDAREGKEKRDQRLSEELSDAHKDLTKAVVRLKLEEGTEATLSLYVEARSAWIGYEHWLRQTESPQGDPDAWKHVQEQLGLIESRAKALESAARDHLSSLGRPIVRFLPAV